MQNLEAVAVWKWAKMGMAGLMLAQPFWLSGAGFIKFDGVDGESRSLQHPGEIEILSYSWGITRETATNGGTAGKVSFKEFTVTKRGDKSSPILARFCVTGQQILELEITLRRGSDTGPRYYTYKLKDVLVSSFSSASSGAGTGDLPMESISLNFSKMEVTYYAVGSDGGEGETVFVALELVGSGVE